MLMIDGKTVALIDAFTAAEDAYNNSDATNSNCVHAWDSYNIAARMLAWRMQQDLAEMRKAKVPNNRTLRSKIIRNRQPTL